MEIREATLADLDDLAEHVARHVQEADGPIFAPYPRTQPFDVERFRKNQFEGWTRGRREPGWRRAWVLHDGRRFVGHADLTGGRLDAELHRATLGIGLEAAARGQGHGRRLLETCLAWARRQDPPLEWIDLGVFAHNAPALSLYERLGFQRVGLTRDRFRVDGESIDDLQMSLRL